MLNCVTNLSTKWAYEKESKYAPNFSGFVIRQKHSDLEYKLARHSKVENFKTFDF